MKIENSSAEDLESIFGLYREASRLQRTKGVTIWPDFDVEMVKGEIASGNQWKLTIDGQIACVWATTFSDPEIWGERNADPSVYIHRIATHPDFRKQNFVQVIVNWAKDFAVQHKLEYIRLDTVAPNEGLVAHYQKCGFNYLGVFQLAPGHQLPPHYHNAEVCLFEIAVS